MIETYRHKIGERIRLVKEEVDSLSLRITRISDNHYFNTQTKDYEVYNAANDANYDLSFSPLYDTGLVQLEITTLPVTADDLLFRLTDNGVTTLERHVIGSLDSVKTPDTALVFGTLLDVSGAPMAGERINVYLNRAGYYVHKSGTIGRAATTTTDSQGYFEIPLIVGLDVTISIDTVGFTQRGLVPAVQSVELTSDTLLSA